MLQKFFERLNDPSSEKGSINIVCLGDSVTQGCFSGGPYLAYDEMNSYTIKLRRILHTLFPSRIFNVINSGIGGHTAELGLSRFDRDVLSYHPDLVVIAFGVNDHADYGKYIASLGKMFDILNEKDIPCIYMTEHMMNTYSDPATEEKWLEYSKVTASVQTNGTMDKIFEGGIALAQSKNIAVCDVYHKWKALYVHGADITQMLDNKINHPIREMHDLFAWSIISTLFFEKNK